MAHTLDPLNTEPSPCRDCPDAINLKQYLGMQKILHIILLIGTLGLWPLWVAVGWVIAGACSYDGPSNDYWSAAPWIIVVSIPMCVVTTLMAFASRYVFQTTEGSPLRQWFRASLTYIAALVGFCLWMKSRDLL